jgi:Bacterial Ig-like domain (group 3)/Beta-propeller repeat
MKRAYFACLSQCLATTFLLPQSNPVPLINQSTGVVSPISASQGDAKAQARILESYGKLPLSFEANHGQTDSRVKFLSRTGGYSLFLTGDEAVLTLSGGKANTHKAKIAGTARTLQSGMAAPKSGGVLRMKLRNANPAAKVTGMDELAGTSNYFIGNDPTKWRTNVPTYAKVKYEGIYSGIDLVYYGNHRQLEYDFIVAPGADPRRIAFDVRGAKRIRQDAHGDLVLNVGEGEIRWHKPLVYQEKDGARQVVAAHYAITDKNRVGFELAKYDAGRPLYIDPLVYSTYVGGSGADQGNGIAVDSAGSAYVTGWTTSTDFPTKNPLQPSYGGSGDAFVAKLNPAGSALLYSTYLGGSRSDHAYGIAVDSSGNAYVAGYTSSTDFPTMNPLQPALYGYEDAFVTEINPTGSALVYSTYLGGSGSDHAYGIAVDSSGNAYVTGITQSTNFPVTPGAIQPACGGADNCASGDAFVTEINPTGSALVYSTYLGGSGGDGGQGIAVDGAGYAYVTGYTSSTDFPTTNALQPTYGGNIDAFVSKLDPTGSALVYSTYLGGTSTDWGYGIAVDSAGDTYVTGITYSSHFPTKNPLQPINHGKYDAFVSKLNPTGSALVYSTYLGGRLSDFGYSIAVDSAGSAYVTGNTESTNFPTKNALQPAFGGSIDAFVAKISPAGSALVYSTYLGGSTTDSGSGIAVDSSGDAYVTGLTYSSDFPTTLGAFQTVCNGGNNCATNGDAFMAKIHIAVVTTTTISSSPDPSIYGQAVTFTAVVTSGLGAPPDGETVSFMKGTTVLGTGTLSGGSVSFTTSTLPAGTDYIKAVYSGDSNYAASTSKAVSQVVSKATTTTALTSSLNPSNFGQSVTFTATVTPQFSGTVKGSVTFYDGTTALKTVALSGGVAKFTTSTLPSGAHSITATYNGSTSFTGSSASLTQTVN